MLRLLVFILSFTSLTLLSAQEKLSANKHIKLAQDLLTENKTSAAAMHYEAAWVQKPKKIEWLNEAAELYLKGREYTKAAEAYSTIKDNKLFPKARLHYALALQQSGRYDDAIPEFLLYLNSYEGKDREQVKDRIEEYIKGCTMAIVQTDSVSLKKKIIEHLSENVNSADDDIAPTPFGDDILYFTNIINGKSKVLRSQQLSNDWSLAQQVENLPILPDVSFGNGAFSPDGSRFYYTQNQNGSIKKGKKTASYLYLITRTDKGWSAPIALPKALNTEGGITTHPFVFQKNDMEYLYFSSDRQGGQGGMDIWYSTRSLKNEAFSEAQNAGSIINTAGDDMTPYFDVEENTLYFASNGRATFGGLDIFKSKGSENRWVTPENIGMPFNSGADDWYYIKNKSKTGGFFVSNRALGVDKITSKDDDIYKFKINTQRELNIAGKVFEKESKALLENARVSLYERKGADNQRLLSSVMCSNGQFSFPILPQKAYILEIEKDAYRVTTFDFNTKDSLKSINRDFFLDKYKVLAAYKPEIPTSKYLENASAAVDVKKTKKNTLEKAVTTESSKTNITPKKTLPVAFKIQIIAYETLDNANRKRLARVDDLGELDTEKALVNGKNFTRVMLTNFNSYAEAVTVLKKVKDRSLTDAFIIRYENGKRTSKNR